jgi:tetratricopeptide (TPR) repeat protein
MSDQGKLDNGVLIQGGRRDLAPIASANSLVSRGVADLVKMRDRFSATRELFELTFRIANDNYLRLRLKLTHRLAGSLHKLWQRAFRTAYIRRMREAGGNAPSYFAFIESGNAWSAKYKHEKAISCFDEGIRRFPGHAISHHFRGMEWYCMERFDEAISDFNDAIRLDPNKADYFTERAHAWSWKEDYDKASNDFQQAIRLGSNEHFRFANWSWAWCMKKDLDKAIASWNEAIHKIPNDSDLYDYRGEVWCFHRKFLPVR